MEVGTGRLRIEQTRTPDFVFWLGQEPQPRQVFGLDGDVGFDLAPNGEASRVPNAEAGDRRAAFYHHPITIIRAALDAVATVTNDLSDDHTIHVITADGVELTCEPGRRQRPPQPVEATRDDANADPTAPLASNQPDIYIMQDSRPPVGKRPNRGRDKLSSRRCQDPPRPGHLPGRLVGRHDRSVSLNEEEIPCATN